MSTVNDAAPGFNVRRLDDWRPGGLRHRVREVDRRRAGKPLSPEAKRVQIRIAQQAEDAWQHLAIGSARGLTDDQSRFRDAFLHKLLRRERWLLTFELGYKDAARRRLSRRLSCEWGLMAYDEWFIHLNHTAFDYSCWHDPFGVHNLRNMGRITAFYTEARARKREWWRRLVREATHERHVPDGMGVLQLTGGAAALEWLARCVGPVEHRPTAAEAVREAYLAGWREGARLRLDPIHWPDFPDEDVERKRQRGLATEDEWWDAKEARLHPERVEEEQAGLVAITNMVADGVVFGPASEKPSDGLSPEDEDEDLAYFGEMTYEEPNDYPRYHQETWIGWWSPLRRRALVAAGRRSPHRVRPLIRAGIQGGRRWHAPLPRLFPYDGAAEWRTIQHILQRNHPQSELRFRGDPARLACIRPPRGLHRMNPSQVMAYWWRSAIALKAVS